MPDHSSPSHVPEYRRLLWSQRDRPYALVIPVINEGQRIRNMLVRMRELGVPALMDIVIVDGGSTDDSLDLDFLVEQGVKGLLLKTGAGKLSAQLRCAYAFCLEQGYGGIITIDGNDKDDPVSLPAFAKALDDGYDFAQASRYIPGGVEENTPLSRTIAIRAIHAPLLRLASGFPWTDTTQGYRAYSAAVLLDPRVAPFRAVFSGYELLAYLSYRVPRLGYRCIELPTARRYPPEGHVPTKISVVSGNLEVMRVLLKACTGRYNPGAKG